MISDLGLTCHTLPGRATVWVNSLAQAAPVDRARVTFYDRGNQVLAEEWINLHLSEPCMLAFAREIYYSPTVRNITIPDDLKGKVLAGDDIAKMVDFDWAYINANRAAWQRKIDREIAG